MALTRQNWSQTHNSIIDAVAEAASKHAAESIERHTLILEMNSLRDLREHIKTTPGPQRQEFNSPLIAISMRDYLNVSEQIIEDVGLLYDRYRRWKDDLEWIE